MDYLKGLGSLKAYGSRHPFAQLFLSRGLFYSQGVSENIRATLLSLGIPEWYPDCLAKIRYLFPMGHCIAYLLVDALVEWVNENLQN